MVNIKQIQPMGDSTVYDLSVRYMRSPDTRSTTINPNDLNANENGIQFDFKQKSITGLSATYSGIMSYRPYSQNSDWTGGPAHQLAFDDDGIHWRKSTGDTTWQAWQDIVRNTGTWGISITGSAGSVAWGNVTDKPGSFTPASHTHDISQISWAGSSNLVCNGANTEWSIDMSSSATGSYWHVWSGKNSATCLQCFNDDRHSWAYKLYGAVWNDYAEFRETKEEIEPGRCIREVGDDTLILTTERLMRGCEIVSDTFGMAIGQSERCNTPTAASGRVLAYPYESLEEFKSHIGYCVCSGPNGTVSIMTEEEEEKYPGRIIGTISAVPDYDIWYCGDSKKPDEVKVNGRVWIRIR